MEDSKTSDEIELNNKSMFEHGQYDSDWSEVEELVEKKEESDVDEAFILDILSEYGTLGLVFYNRFKET